MRLDIEDSEKGKRIADAIYDATVHDGAVNWAKFGRGIQSVLEAEQPSPSALAQASWHVASVYPHPDWPARVRQALDAALQVSLVKAQIEANAELARASEKMEQQSLLLTRSSVWLAVAGLVVALLSSVVSALH
jgi:hypothetical protein